MHLDFNSYDDFQLKFYCTYCSTEDGLIAINRSIFYLIYCVYFTTLSTTLIKSNITVTYPEIFWEYRFQQGISGQEPKMT